MKVEVYENPDSIAIYVKQKEAVVADLSTPLYTTGMVTCSALIVTDGVKHFLSHIDAMSCSYALAGAVGNHFDLNDTSLKLAVVTGQKEFSGTDLSRSVISAAVRKLDLEQNTVLDKEIYTDSMHAVVSRWGSYETMPAKDAFDLEYAQPTI